MNYLESPGPFWRRGPWIIGSDGSFSAPSAIASDGSIKTDSGTLSITTAGIITATGNQSFSCAMDSGKSIMACTDGGNNTGMGILTKEAASYSMADLAGTWEINSLESPGPLWRRGPFTIGSDGSFSAPSAIASDGSIKTDSGTFSITTGGILTNPTGSQSFSCAMDSGKSIMACTESNLGSSSSDTGMDIFTRQAASYSVADLAGTWEVNQLASPGPAWYRGTAIIGSDGSLSGTINASDGSTSTASETLSITTDGIITQTGGDTFRCAMDSSKNVFVCTDGGTSHSTNSNTTMGIFTKQAGSSSSTQNTLNVNTAGTGSGTVAANSGTISWNGSTGTASYSSGTSVTLTATPSSASTFTSWSGCDSTSGTTCTVAMTSSRSVTATFGSCTYTLSPTSQSVASTGGSESVSVTTSSGCPWTASSTLSWATITSGSSGTGSGTVNYSVSANTRTSSQTGSITIAGQTFSVMQAGQTSGNIITVGSVGLLRAAAYSTIQGGFNACGNDNIIEVEAGTFPENDNFSSNVSTTLIGGYDSGFSTFSSYSTITGMLIISGGSVSAQNIIIQP
ncbi:MAG: BACON domain-containing carbohydrate-binding protein [Dissulfurispiraceae bacterium]